MKQQDFHKEETILTPEQEVKYRLALAENAALRDENAELKEQLAYLKKIVYGQKSEKSEVVLEKDEQLSLFNETEEEAEVSVKGTHTTEVKAHKRVKRTRDEIMADLPVEEVFHEAEDRTCDRCGSEMVVIGKEKIRDELVYVPARMYLRRHVAEVVKCTSCGRDEAKDAGLADIEKCNIRTAGVPAPMIPGSFCTPELLAHIAYEKYCNAVPLYRLEKDFAAKGVSISRTTMANWIVTASSLWLKPVWNQMHRELVTSDVIHADETVVQVLNEPGKKAKTDSRMWVYCNGKTDGHSNILFEYQPTRNGDHASRFLGDYRGYLVCDGYDGYNKLKSAVRCGCWAHARRKFVEALPSDKTLIETSTAAKGVEYCNKLFMLERKFNGLDEKGNKVSAPLSPEQRYDERQKYSRPLIDEFFGWLEGLIPAGGTKLAKAVSYAKSERKYLYRFLESGAIPIDNNRAENAVRPFCIGRKNWLFSASVKGVEASAMLYSVAATACANGINVENYLTELFRSPPGSLVMPY